MDDGQVKVSGHAFQGFIWPSAHVGLEFTMHLNFRTRGTTLSRTLRNLRAAGDCIALQVSCSTTTLGYPIHLGDLAGQHGGSTC
jgi:hypothetical protein